MAAKQFRVIARARASALIPRGFELSIPCNIDGAAASFTFRTLYIDLGFADLVPSDLWMEATSEGASLDATMEIVTNLGRDLAATLALSANASVAPLETEIGYEVTPGVATRPFYQRLLPARELAQTSRTFSLEATAALLLAAGQSEGTIRNRVIRATSQYTEALAVWAPGSELPALAHLFMGVEAITPAVLRHHLATTGRTREQLGAEWGFHEDGGAASRPLLDQLAAEWGYVPKRGRMSLGQFLEQQARVRLVFQGDEPTHRVAKKTSDEFEHGLRNAGQLHEPARDCLRETARYLRESIFTVVELPQDARSILLSGDYARPRGPAETSTILRGSINSNDETLAAPGELYPYFEWKSEIHDAKIGDNGKLVVDVRQQHRPIIASGVTVTDLKIVVFDLSMSGRFANPSITLEET